jgi:curved DNA-binding protein CbpA
MDPWDTLGVAHDVAVRDLRRRYATLIKEFRPETHPQEFARIREAYEIALELGRRREAQTAVEAEAEAASNEPFIASDTTALESTEAPAHAPQEAPIAPASESTETVVVTPLAAAEPQTRDAGPTLAQRFLQLHAEVASAGLADDEAHLPALRALLRAGSRAAIDDSQALEFALLRWFLESDAPPLTLVFEAGRAFGWHGQEQRLSAWLSAPASRRLEALLALARDRVHARHFSGNAALRRLHRRDNPFVAVASRPAALEAVQWAERWEALCERVDGSELGAATPRRPRTSSPRRRWPPSWPFRASTGCDARRWPWAAPTCPGRCSAR